MARSVPLEKTSDAVSQYAQRLSYSAQVFRITLRLFGGILLIVQLVKAVLSAIAGEGFMRGSIAGAIALAVLLLVAAQPPLLEKAIAKLTSRSRRSSLAIGIYLFPLLLSLFILYAKIRIGVDSDQWRYVSSEGSVSEYGTALAYLLVPFFAYPVAKQFRRQKNTLMATAYWLFIAGAFFVGMEEISWGQRLLGFEEPEFWSKHNVQSEFTFHNFAFFQENFLTLSFLIAGFLGSFCWIILRFWRSRPPKPNAQLNLNYILPDWPISSFFYPIFLFYVAIDYTNIRDYVDFIGIVDQEHWEFVMSLGVLLFAIVSFFRQAKEHDQRKLQSSLLE